MYNYDDGDRTKKFGVGRSSLSIIGAGKLSFLLDGSKTQ
jgi:hypothetical protein